MISIFKLSLKIQMFFKLFDIRFFKLYDNNNVDDKTIDIKGIPTK